MKVLKSGHILASGDIQRIVFNCGYDIYSGPGPGCGCDHDPFEEIDECGCDD